MDGCTKPPGVAICIASHRRPQGLHALLGALEGLRFEGERPGLVLVVADNDAAESARPVCEDARRWLSLPLRYVVEPRQGIPFARNAALRVAGDADWLAFIDDDEVPDARWLDTLLRVQRETDADVVTGPVLPRFEREPAPWLVQGEFFASSRRSTGTRLASAYTHNALLRARSLDPEFVQFDERLRVGEDAELFSRLALRGARIVWADDAIVYESVPPERARAGWILRRSLFVGAAVTRIARIRGGWLRAAGGALAHGTWCLVKGLAQAALRTGTRGDRAGCVRGLELAAYGVGRIAGLAGAR